MFILKKILAALLLPPALPLMVILAGLTWLTIRRKSRLALASVWLGTAVLVFLATPISAHFLGVLANRSTVVDMNSAERAQAIVILGGGIRRDAVEYGGDTLKWMSLERIRYGARLARATGLPILVTGGIVFDGESEASLMKDILEREWRIPVRWTEAGSRNTHENAALTATLLIPQGVTRIVLVTHGFHMLRAKAEFEAAGFVVVPAATGLPRTMSVDDPRYFIPDASTALSSYYALHELLGYWTFRLSTL